MTTHVKPMRLAEYDAEFARFPLIAQPKLDGFHCGAAVENGVWVLRSVSGIVFPLPHLTAALAASCIDRSALLDGQLYIHGCPLERLQSLISARSELVEFWIFDRVNGDTAGARLGWVFGMSDCLRAPLHALRHKYVRNRKQVDDLHASTVAAGYEGLVLRTPTGVYVQGARGWDALKLKTWNDAEFRVVAIEPGAGAQAHLYHLTVRNDIDDTTFTVLASEIIKDPATVVGQLLTCRFCGRTRRGLPRSAVAMRLRPAFDVVGA
jgi:hypothetical protein